MLMMQKMLNIVPIILVGVAASITVFFAVYRLEEAPGIWYDEGFYTQVAMNLAREGFEGLQVAPGEFVSAKDVTVGYPLIAPVAFSYDVFGIGVLKGRAVMVIFIIAFMIVAYIFVYLLYGPWFAAWSLLLLATFPELYGNGKSVLGEVPGMFYLILALCSLVWLERSAYKKILPYALLGLMCGLAVATKPIFILFPVALAIAFLVRFSSIRLRTTGIVWGTMLFLSAIGVWLHLQFGAGDSFISILNYYVNPYDVNAGTSVVRNIKLFVTEAVPIYVLGMLILWGFSMYLRKQKNEITAAEITAFVFCLSVIIAFLRLPGWYRYLFPATLLAMFFLPRASVDVYAALSARLRVLMKITWLPYLALSLLCSAQLYALANHSYVARYYAGNRTHALSAYLATLPEGASYFIYNSPEVAILLPSKKYYQFISPHPNQHIGEEVLPVLTRGGTDFVILTTEAYHTNKDLFKAYTEKGIINRFTFLEKI